jgi:hypothetical protein
MGTKKTNNLTYSNTSIDGKSDIFVHETSKSSKVNYFELLIDKILESCHMRADEIFT